MPPQARVAVRVGARGGVAVFHISDDLFEKAAVFAVGCCALGLAPSADAAATVATAGAALLSIAGVAGFQAIFGKKPECQTAVGKVLKKRPRQFQLANEADGRQ